MIWSKWNAADKTLLFAATVFLLALCLHLEYPESMLADGLLFCAEAALVGGAADWFAVTAIFRRPLGFPYHTAILPRRRASFVEASATMVRREFFSRRKVFRLLKATDLRGILMGLLTERETEDRIVLLLVHGVRSRLLHDDAEMRARALAAAIRERAAQLDPAVLYRALKGWLSGTGGDRVTVAKIAMLLHARVAGDEACERIEAFLKKVIEGETEDAAGGLGSFLMGLAEGMDIVNYGEAAELIQKHTLTLLEELGRDGSDKQRELLSIFYERAEFLLGDPAYRALLGELLGAALAALPLEETLAGVLRHIESEFVTESVTAGGFSMEEAAIRRRTEELCRSEYRRMVALIGGEGEAGRAASALLYDVAARTALHAQSLIAVIVESVLSRMTDEEINRLVYEKVEPDLLWIRMNGSIVGATIGLVLFCATHLLPV